ncbi:hypothetical protein, partial [Vibrio genomosp. F10]|uniref:hypothetical protein n=1 Tax=Vibrio genomosp. F10 TaxID=723171 RepID=UPI00056FEF2D
AFDHSAISPLLGRMIKGAQQVVNRHLHRLLSFYALMSILFLIGWIIGIISLNFEGDGKKMVAEPLRFGDSGYRVLSLWGSGIRNMEKGMESNQSH